jgi:hypothetical protein
MAPVNFTLRQSGSGQPYDVREMAADLETIFGAIPQFSSSYNVQPTTSAFAGALSMGSFTQVFVAPSTAMGAMALPFALPGYEIDVINIGNQTCSVYPSTLAQTINNVSSFTPCAPGTVLIFFCGSGGGWWTK